MSRPLRIEFPGAIYHLTSWGDRREPIFVDDLDRQSLLAVVAQVADRFDAEVLAYCLMGNHYHFVLHTRKANLSQLMRQLNGVYTQAFNRRHQKVGHLFQGRFKAVLVDRDAYLLEVCRYVELNPVRAGMVPSADAWPWSSYLAHVGAVDGPLWLDTHGLHAYLLAHDPRDADESQLAARRYAALVEAGRHIDLWGDALRQQIYLGDESFVERMQALTAPTRRTSGEVPKAQRLTKLALKDLLAQGVPREQAMLRCLREGGMTMTEIAREAGLSVSRVSRLIAQVPRQ